MKVAPSILSLDYTKLSEQVHELNESGAEYIHFDVMDGHFVPNLTFGPDILRAFRKMSPLAMDVHMMVTDPDYFADVFAKAGADIITFHEEAANDGDQIRKLAQKIRSFRIKPGLSIKPKTPIENLKPYLNDFDLFLIMTVEPGFGGQKFMAESVERIQKLRYWLDTEKSSALIEVDGGINAETGKLAREAGADILVAGSYIFKNNIGNAVKNLG